MKTRCIDAELDPEPGKIKLQRTLLRQFDNIWTWDVDNSDISMLNDGTSITVVM